MQASTLADATPKVLYPQMPVLHVKAALAEKQSAAETYGCPVYKTRQRGPTYVFEVGLRTKNKPATWVLAGVAMLMDVGG